MKIAIFYGSIHKTRGNTYVIINEFAEGAKEAGAEVEVVLLAEKEINKVGMQLTQPPAIC